MSGYAEYVSDSLQIGHPATCRSWLYAGGALASVTGLVAAAAGETGIGGWWPARLCRLHTGQTRQAVLIPPTVQFYAKFCTETILIKQNRQRKRKRRIYICLMSQARNIHPVVHLSCLILNKIELNRISNTWYTRGDHDRTLTLWHHGHFMQTTFYRKLSSGYF